MVKVAALIKMIERIAWKAGTHEKVEHHVDAEGNHRIVVTVPKALAEWDAPAALPSPAVYRGMTWDELRPPPKKR